MPRDIFADFISCWYHAYASLFIIIADALFMMFAILIFTPLRFDAIYASFYADAIIFASPLFFRYFFISLISFSRFFATLMPPFHYLRAAAAFAAVFDAICHAAFIEDIIFAWYYCFARLILRHISMPLFSCFDYWYCWYAIDISPLFSPLQRFLLFDAAFRHW